MVAYVVGDKMLRIRVLGFYGGLMCKRRFKMRPDSPLLYLISEGIKSQSLLLEDTSQYAFVDLKEICAQVDLITLV